jgi:hypothetical protein
VPISPIWQKASQADKAPRAIGHKLRFALPPALCFIEALQARGQSARRTQRLPHERALRPIISGRKSPKERFVQRKLHKTTPYADLNSPQTIIFSI